METLDSSLKTLQWALIVIILTTLALLTFSVKGYFSMSNEIWWTLLETNAISSIMSVILTYIRQSTAKV